MSETTKLIKRHFHLSSEKKLSHIISVLDKIAALAEMQSSADFTALMYRKSEQDSPILISYSLGCDTPLESLNYFENRWVNGFVDYKEFSLLKTDDEEFAQANQFKYKHYIPCKIDGVNQGVIVQYWKSKPKTLKQNTIDILIQLTSMLVDTMLTIENINLTDNYSMRLFELTNVFDLPMGDFRFKDFISEVVKCTRHIVQVKGICLLAKDTDSDNFSIQEYVSESKPPKLFLQTLQQSVQEEYGNIETNLHTPGRWDDLSQYLKKPSKSIIGISISPEKYYQYILVAWTEEDSIFSTVDLELLSVFSMFAKSLLKNALMVKGIKKAKRMIEKSSSRMIDIETTAALADMTSGVAHEFNNIIGGVVGRLQLLKMKIDSEPLEKEIEKIESLIMEGAHTIKRIQEFTITANNQRFEAVNLLDVVSTIIDDSTNTIQKNAKDRGITLKLINNISNLNILGNQSDILIAIEKVIENSIDFSPENSVVTLELTEDKKYFYLQISDEGCGIPVGIRPKVFYPFYTTKNTRAAGLSLSIVHGVISRHRGRITIKDNSPKGTIFELAFVKPDKMDIDSDVKTNEKNTENLKILVVDDDKQIREVLFDMLSMYGHILTTCNDAYEAIEQLDKQGFDLLITDLGMPGMSGLELAKVAHQNSPKMPIAMITGWGTQLNHDEVKANGIKTVLAKPFHLHEIRALIEDMV